LGVPDLKAQTRAVIFPVGDPEENEATLPYRDILYNALERRFTLEGFEVIPQETVVNHPGYARLRGRDRFSGEALLPVAAELGAQTMVLGIYGLESERLVMRIKALDVRTGKVVASVMDYTLEGLAGYNFVETISEGLSPQLQFYRSHYDPREPYGYWVVDIIFYSSDTKFGKNFFHSTDEGMTIGYGTGYPTGVMSGGKLRLPFFSRFPADTVITIEKSKEGYYPATEEILLREGPNEIIPRRLDKKYSHEASLYYLFQDISGREGGGSGVRFPGGGAGAGYRYYITPDYVFAGPDIRFYLRPEEGGNRGSHLDLSAHIGSYLFSSYKSYVRFSAAAGMGMIMSFLPGDDNYLDFYVNLMSLSMDINIRPWTIFFQGDLRFCLGGPGEANLYRSWETPNNFPLTIGVRKKW
jgi:hypothetical protein